MLPGVPQLWDNPRDASPGWAQPLSPAPHAVGKLSTHPWAGSCPRAALCAGSHMWLMIDGGSFCTDIAAICNNIWGDCSPLRCWQWGSGCTSAASAWPRDRGSTVPSLMAFPSCPHAHAGSLLGPAAVSRLQATQASLLQN